MCMMHGKLNSGREAPYACASIYCKKGVTKLSGIGRHALPSNPSFLNIDMQLPLTP